jgi:hypothetical protein
VVVDNSYNFVEGTHNYFAFEENYTLVVDEIEDTYYIQIGDESLLQKMVSYFDLDRVEFDGLPLVETLLGMENTFVYLDFNANILRYN